MEEPPEAAMLAGPSEAAPVEEPWEVAVLVEPPEAPPAEEVLAEAEGQRQHMVPAEEEDPPAEGPLHGPATEASEVEPHESLEAPP